MSTREISRLPAKREVPSRRRSESTAAVPALISASGAAARFAYDEFFFGRLRNPHTRRAYQRAVDRFLEWCADRGLELHEVTPRDVGVYLDQQGHAATTNKLLLSALRHFFDDLVNRHVLILNPAATVRGARCSTVEGRTPEIPPDQARRLLANIDTGRVVGLRDRAIIAVLIYTAARVGAVARLRRGDFYDAGNQHLLHFREKGGKSREIPVRHDLEQMLFEFLVAAGLQDAADAAPLFPTTVRRTGALTRRPMTAGDMGRMVKRRMRDAGLSARLSPHSFRVTTITDLLTQGVPLEDVQYLAGHSDPRTTRLYDRRQRQVTRNIVERISI